jgi:hypothetical protein
MKSNLFIKYRGLGKNDSEIDLATLGESIIGFDIAIKEIFKISKINAEPIVRVNKTREGSLIVDIVLIAIIYKDHIPFDKIPDLLNFLEITNHNLWIHAKNYFGVSWGTAKHLHRTANDYFKENPLDQEILSHLLTGFIAYFFGKAQGQKKHPDYNQLSKEYALAAHRMIKKHRFKKALKPFIDEKVTSIELSDDKNFKKSSLITSENFENYLSEDEKILPLYENGKIYEFTGKVVAMQCSKGDSLKLQIHGFSRKERDLLAYPPVGQTTKDLDSFYEEDVVVNARVERKSLYQKPKLHILDVRLYKQSMF